MVIVTASRIDASKTTSASWQELGSFYMLTGGTYYALVIGYKNYSVGNPYLQVKVNGVVRITNITPPGTTMTVFCVYSGTTFTVNKGDKVSIEVSDASGSGTYYAYFIGLGAASYTSPYFE